MAVRSGNVPSFRGHRSTRKQPAILPQHDDCSQLSDDEGVEKKNGYGVHNKLLYLWLRVVRRNKETSKCMFLLWFLLSWCLLLFVWVGEISDLQFSHYDYSDSFQSHTHRRILILESPFQTRNSFTNNGEEWKPTIHIIPEVKVPTNLHNEKWYTRNRMVFDDQETGCPFIADWQSQTSAKPTCNQLHETGIQFGDSGLLHRLEPIDSGGFKDVWQVMDEDDNPADFVLKTTLYENDFREKDLNEHRRDAIIMDEATSSPYVLNIYGYCGHSNLVERAVGTLRNWLKKYRDRVDPIDLLRLSVTIAGGVADMHLYHNDMPTAAHADVKVSQFLMVETGHGGDSVDFKINDFNRGGFLTSKTPPEICPFYIGGTHVGSTSRAPEEYIENSPLTEKIDVFSTGAVLYYILTGYAPFDDEEEYSDAIKKITSGVEWRLPEHILHSKDPTIIAILDVIKKCRQFRPEDRPNSREVANLLAEEYSRIRSGKDAKDESDEQ